MIEPSANIVYLDTNVLIRAVEGNDEASRYAKDLIRILRQKSANISATSEITLAEVLASPKRPDVLPLEVRRRAYLDLLIWSGFIALIPVSRDILIETSNLRVVANLKLPDAVHLVSAIHRGCRFFVSADEDFEKLPSGIERINTDEPGLTRLMSELS